ncbi:MAG TPA: serine/threonine-protein kinase [Acidimicrobiales bacterium]|nr:serine/threonine-protein kinase [Acidimicrobiales bacterium]
MTTSPPPVRSNGAVPARTIGRYRVVRLLGTGGFSTVYLARDDRLDADVAIKVLAENWCTDDEISRRFVDEARLLRRCDDDRVVRVHTIEQLDDGRPYFVMDYADAGTLADRAAAALDDGRPFGVREAVALSRELADCLTVVHDNGIVHRDLKPSNVLFRTTRSGERMLLGDFGLARQLLSSTGRTILAGTPEYVAPEQADPALAGTVDERADVYAAAVILYELLTGAVPFTHANFEAAAAARQGPPDVRAARPDVPAAVAEAVARGMAADRDARFPSGRAWLSTLDSVLAALPEAASPAWPLAAAPFAAPTAAAPPTAATPPAAATPPFALTTPVPPSPRTLGPVPAPTAAADDGDADHAPSPPPPASPAPRKPLWPLVAGVLGALAVIAAVAVLLGRGGGTPAASTAGPSVPQPTVTQAPVTTAAPLTTAAPPVSTPAVPLTGPAAWFAAASGPTCRPATVADKLPGVLAAVTCTYPGVTAVFGETASATEATAFLGRLDKRRAGASATPWAGGQAVSYGGASDPSIAWDYTGQPYVAVAVGTNRATLASWWVSTGRVVRAG